MKADERCENCSMKDACRNSRISDVFFLVGIVATVSMRVIEPLRNVDPLYGKLAWYIGVAGFFLFFVYKYKQSRDRSKTIYETGLKQKISGNEPLTDKERKLVSELLCSTDNRKEQINFFIIFALSLLALVIALIMDLA